MSLFSLGKRKRWNCVSVLVRHPGTAQFGISYTHRRIKDLLLNIMQDLIIHWKNIVTLPCMYFTPTLIADNPVKSYPPKFKGSLYTFFLLIWWINFTTHVFHAAVKVETTLMRKGDTADDCQGYLFDKVFHGIKQFMVEENKRGTLMLQ